MSEPEPCATNDPLGDKGSSGESIPSDQFPEPAGIRDYLLYTLTLTLHSLDQIANIGQGALSTARAAGRLFDRHVIDHYQAALADIQTRGFYAILAESSGPYIEAVWKNFSTEKPTLTEDLLSGKLVGQAARSVGRWLGFTPGSDQPD